MGRLIGQLRALWIVIGALAVVGLAAWWALPQLWSPPEAPGIRAVSTDSPLDNLWSGSAAETESSESESSADAGPDGASSQAAGLGLVQERGRLVLEIDGARMGEEIYQLSRGSNGGFVLASRGRFSVQVWFATVAFDYTQQLHMDASFRPETYRLDLDGPLGVGSRHIRASVSADEVRVRTGREPATLSLAGETTTFIGVLASYAFLPKLIDETAETSLTAIVFDVRRTQPAASASVPAVPLDVTRQGRARLQSVAQDQAIETTRYRLDLRDEPEADLTMYARDGEFIGLTGRFSPDNPPFRIYRADRLPGGFTLEAPP